MLPVFPVVNRLSNQSGISRLEFAVVAVVFGILATVLLGRMLQYEASTERMQFDLAVRELQEASWVRVATLLVTQQAVNYEKLAQENPIAWLARKPQGYIGEIGENAEKGIAGDQWVFDSRAKVLIYRPHHASSFAGLTDKNGLVRVNLSLIYGKNDTLPSGLKLSVQQSSY